MADAYWKYSDPRQQHPLRPQMIAPIVGKRPRSDFDVPGGHELANYYRHTDDRGVPHVSRDTDSINASYDRYLRDAISSYGGAQPASTVTGGAAGHLIDDPRIMGIAAVQPGPTVKDRIVGYEDRRPEVSLPPDATSTVYVEGLPANCTRREVAHIFRPFVGYEEVRLVKKESRLQGGDQLVLCFVDFRSPAHAATALDALQGYKFDENDRDSDNLRLQFARHPGARSGGGQRGKR